MRRFYGCSVDDFGGPGSWGDAAAMAAHLPSDSALRRAEGDGWSEAERLLAEIADSTAVIRWQPTNHSIPGNDKPPRCRSPRERERIVEDELAYTPEYMDWMAKRLGVEGRV